MCWRRSAGQPVDSVGRPGKGVRRGAALEPGSATRRPAGASAGPPAARPHGDVRDQQHTTGATCAAIEYDLLVGRTAEAYERAVLAVRFENVDQLDSATLLAESAVRACAAHTVQQQQAGLGETTAPAAAFASQVAEWIHALLSATPGLAGHPHQSVRGVTISAEAARAGGRGIPEQWWDAAEQWDALDWPWDAAYALLRATEALISSPTAPAARARIRRDLKRVRDTAVALGATPLITEVAAAARRSGLALADEAPAAHDGGGSAGPSPASKARSHRHRQHLPS